MASGPLPIEDAPAEGRELLGALLAQRRKELGYTHWPAFARDRLPLTPKGNPNTRLLADIEKAYRSRFPEPTLRLLAQAYQVDYRSLLDVAHLRRNTLTPVSSPPAPAALPVPGEPPGWLAGDEARSGADRPFADEIRGRLKLLRAQGIPAPSGGELFPDSPADARDWDKYAADGWTIRDLTWFIADMQRRKAGRAPGPDAGTGESSALRRGNIAGPRLMRHLPGVPASGYRLHLA
jgi:hypothetical protein